MSEEKAEKKLRTTEEEQQDAHQEIMEHLNRLESAFKGVSDSLHEANNTTLTRLKFAIDLQQRAEQMIDLLISYRRYRP